MPDYHIEFWADSFHEGDWICRGLTNYFKFSDVNYIDGFIPRYKYKLNEHSHLFITVFGSYNNWSPLPDPIGDLLEWGKPDLIIYEQSSKKVLLALEETAAVPTGNQALQRCERIYGSARSLIPFWYLLSEYGLHLDGGIRTDSIWPTILAFKLSYSKRIPSVVLHFADRDNPENYDIGEGTKDLFDAISQMVKIRLGLDDRDSMLPLLEGQYQRMLDFVLRQWSEITNFLPGLDNINKDGVSSAIARYVWLQDADRTVASDEFFVWGNTKSLPSEIYDSISPGGLIKYDPFLDKLEALVQNKEAYNLSTNTGSRPQQKESVLSWINEQKKLFEKGNATNAEFDMSIDQFPESQTGRLHVFTAKNIVYLCDSWGKVWDALTAAYPRLLEVPVTNNDKPVLIYVSNSIKPGRIFGDPFTGQLSAFSNIFAKDLHGNNYRTVLIYYPHQSYTQLFDQPGKVKT
ncbi:hypothetical protein KA005_59700, partial [bacterium]|nr:hypothetical protein [bacterium]